MHAVAQPIGRAAADMQLAGDLRHGRPFCQKPAYLLTGRCDRLAAQAFTFSTSAFETGPRPTRDLLPFQRRPGQSDGGLDVPHLPQLRVLVDPRIVVEPSLTETHYPHTISIQLSQVSKARRGSLPRQSIQIGDQKNPEPP